jgi:DNA-binding MarR family transcriptional regulator
MKSHDIAALNKFYAWTKYIIQTKFLNISTFILSFMLKPDYRKGQSALRRKNSSHWAIIIALKNGRKTFSQLLKETALSRSTLASHLKEMVAKGEVEREADTTDYRITYYRLKNYAWSSELQKEEDVHAIDSMEIVYSIPPEAISNFFRKLADFLEPSLREYIIRIEADKSLTNYVSYSIYVGSSESRAIGNNLGKIAEKGVLAMLSEIVKAPELLDQSSDFTIVFRFNKKKITELIQKLENERKSNEGKELLKFPDISDYEKG